ncbi:hypothetical protein, partial [Bacillus sp. V5-8f]|uniref:hypothetical protein n=1 Tax=Bacillus sp. V5-8f TaxID=2053044 RepID=UPI001C60C8F4
YGAVHPLRKRLFAKECQWICNNGCIGDIYIAPSYPVPSISNFYISFFKISTFFVSQHKYIALYFNKG